jgi:phosphoribosylanthranilate isomerase
MRIKVCGLTTENQIKRLDQISQIDFLGFIFYSKSKRFFNQLPILTKNSKRVGVFVNEEIDKIIDIASFHQLDYIQLHGDEDVIYCRKMMNQIMMTNQQLSIIKAYGVDDNFDFKQLTEFESLVDYFLFDTKTENYGGSGKAFNWEIINHYQGNIPFLLSGGIKIEMSDEIKNIDHKRFIGIDINSGFEFNPGDKNVDKIDEFVVRITTVLN